MELYAFLILGALAGGFINGLAGTGTALFALGFYTVVLEPTKAVAIVALMSALVGLQGLWIVRAQILTHPGRLLRFILPGLAGVPLGLMLLDVIDATILRMVIATLLVVYGAYFGFRASLPAFTRPTPKTDIGVGLIGGVLGGAAGVSGAIPAMWLSMRPWPKAEVRAVMQPLNVVLLSTTVTLLFLKGAYDAQALQALAITVPTGFLAAQFGIFVFRRLSDTTFRRLVILLSLVMGLGIMVSEAL